MSKDKEILPTLTISKQVEEEINDWFTIAPKYRTKKYLKARLIKLEQQRVDNIKKVEKLKELIK